VSFGRPEDQRNSKENNLTMLKVPANLATASDVPIVLRPLLSDQSHLPPWTTAGPGLTLAPLRVRPAALYINYTGPGTYRYRSSQWRPDELSGNKHYGSTSGW
jgi:hypothetical protein